MPDYEFVFVVDGISLDDHTSVRSLTEDLDALLSCSHGVHRMAVTGAGPDAVTAAKAVAVRALELAPAMRLLRVDRDLVGVSDIAERTGRSRQNVTQWVRGQRRDGAPFPAPEGAVGRSLVWLWCEVNEWLREIGLDDGERWPTRAEMVEIDWRLRAFQAVRLNLVARSDRDDVRQVSEQLIEQARTNRDFIDYLARHPQVRGPGGQYTIFVCSPDDAALDVFRRLARFPHSVVLATATTEIHTVVMDTGSGERAATSELESGMTVRDWLGLISLFPDREFTAGADGSPTLVPRSFLELAPS